MASKASAVDFITEQISRAGKIASRKLFGEYAIYCDSRLVTLVRNDELFIKPTAAGRMHLGDVTEAAPYQGAKPYLLVPGDLWDDRDSMTTLFRVSALELPLPDKSKRKNTRRRR